MQIALFLSIIYLGSNAVETVSCIGVRMSELTIDGIQVDEEVDITDVVCPVTFVKAKVALEELEDGQILSVHLNDGEPVLNVPRSIKEEGHQILKLIDNGDGTYNLLVKKVEE